MIIISLFDEVEFDDRRSGGYLEDEIAIRREKRFLGSVVLPFQVIWLEKSAPNTPATRKHAVQHGSGWGSCSLGIATTVTISIYMVLLIFVR